MKIKPLGWKIIIEPNKGDEGVTIPEELQKLGFEVKQGMDADEVRRSVLSLEVGKVIDIGPLAWMRQDMQGNRTPDQWKPWAKVGDRVIFSKFAGKLIRDPEAPDYYLLMNDEDIQVVYEGE